MQARGAWLVSRGRLPRLFPVLLVLLGAGCAQPDRADPVVVLQQALASHQASLASVAPRTPTAGGEGSVAPPAAPRSGAAAVAAVAAPDISPTVVGQLVGQPPAAVTAWLGQPRLRREEGSAEIWHYQAPQCHLDLVFYRDEQPPAALRVAFAAARAIGTARRNESACLRDITRGAAAPTRPASATEDESAPGAGA